MPELKEANQMQRFKTMNVNMISETTIVLNLFALGGRPLRGTAVRLEYQALFTPP